MTKVIEVITPSKNKVYLYGTVWDFVDHKVWNHDKKEWDYLYSSYNELIEMLHPDVSWTFEMDNDYQGDFFTAGTDGQDWYFIQGSFGSCGGCDWLQSVFDSSDIGGFLELLTHYKKTVIVKPSRAELIAYMEQTLQNVSWSRGTLKTLIGKI